VDGAVALEALARLHQRDPVEAVVLVEEPDMALRVRSRRAEGESSSFA